MPDPVVTCDGCGQQCIGDAAWTVRGFGTCCRQRLYGAEDRHESPPLFDCGPAPLPGQLELPPRPNMDALPPAGRAAVLTMELMASATAAVVGRTVR